jgi:MerR family transcriptional regulator/heat shock protein HspR
MRSRSHAVYVISVAAELAGMHPQTLRIYERRGLLSPARTSGGNRRYSDADIARLRRIAELAATGMNLEGIRHVMVLEQEVARLREEVGQLRNLAAAAINEIERRANTAGTDLVPLRQAIQLFTDQPGPLRPRR